MMPNPYQFDTIASTIALDDKVGDLQSSQIQMRVAPQRNMMNVMEYCTRIQQEFLYLERQFSTTRSEAVVLKEQKDHLQDKNTQIQKEMEKLKETNAQLMSLFPSILNELPFEMQVNLKKQLERVIESSHDSNHIHNRNLYLEDTPVMQSQQIKLQPSHKRPEPTIIKEIHPPTEEELEEEDEQFEDDDDEEYDEDNRSKTKRKRTSEVLDPGGIKKEDLKNRMKDKLSTTRSESPRNIRNNSPVYGTPKMVRLVNTFNHKEVVCSCVFNKQGDRVVTGGKGTIKFWDVKTSFKPLIELSFGQESYVRSMKMSNRGKYLIAAGEAKEISVWSLDGPIPRAEEGLKSTAPKCYGLCVSEVDENIFFTGYSNGSIGMWDINSRKQVKTLTGHSDYVSCLELSADGTKLVSAGLDNWLRVWDVTAGKELTSYKFSNQIFAMAVCPNESWVSLGMENNMIEVLNLSNVKSKYQIDMHESSVLSLSYAHSGKWFISTGKDRTMTCWKSPFGGSIFSCHEPNSILCSDISQDDTHILTGSGEKLASLYQLTY